MRDQQSKTSCATEWANQSTQEQYDMVKYLCSKCRMHPKRTKKMSFSSLVLRVFNQLKFMGECVLCMEMYLKDNGGGVAAKVPFREHMMRHNETRPTLSQHPRML
jgi:hypothetical protein